MVLSNVLPRSVLGLFTNVDIAADAMDALKEAGFVQSEYEVLTGTPYPDGTFGEAEPTHWPGGYSHLRRHSIDSDREDQIAGA